ncbi:MAG: Bug family tripartite tricarboxylate transporter substrate binding protein, partial [Rubrivivax sp.]
MNLDRPKAFLRVACLAWLGLWAIAPAAHAQAFPQAGKPLRIIVPFPAGGQTDIQARALAPKLQASLGVPVLVENKPGASTFIGVQDLMRSAPDGHTILYTIGVTVMQNPHLYAKLPYDAFKDLAPLMFAARSGTVLIVPAAAPYSTVKELVAFAKANPGKLNFGSFSNGSTSHLYGELLKEQTGTFMVHIPFKGSGDAGVALIGNQVQLLFDGPTTAINMAKAGRVKMLGVTDKKRLASLPDVPTMAEAGVPGLDLEGGMMFYAPAKTPPEFIKRLNEELAKALKDPAVAAL